MNAQCVMHSAACHIPLDVFISPSMIDVCIVHFEPYSQSRKLYDDNTVEKTMRRVHVYKDCVKLSRSLCSFCGSFSLLVIGVVP